MLEFYYSTMQGGKSTALLQRRYNLLSIGKRVVCVDDVFIHHHLSASFNKLKDSERQELFGETKKYMKRSGVHGFRIPTGLLVR